MLKRLLNSFRGNWLSRQISREFDFRIAERAEQLMRSGMKPFDADWAARRKFGAYAIHQEDTWMNNVLGWFETLLADLRYALRGLAKSPVFATVAVLSLALGIGANTAIFSLINAVVLRSLPVRHPEELVKLRIEKDQDYLTNPMWEQIRDHRDDVFANLFAWGNVRFNTAQGGEARYIDADYVSGDYFGALGIGPQLGRTVSADDDRKGCAPIAVISSSFWDREYGRDRTVLGRMIALANHNFQIVGVTQAGFDGLDVGRSPDVFVPVCSEAFITGAQSALPGRSTWWLRIAGRLKPGVSISQVNARLAVQSKSVLEATVPERWKPDGQKQYLSNIFAADPMPTGASGLRSNYADPLQSLMFAVGLVLLIACANVANLLLARATSREREMAVRLSLGASRSRLIRQTLTESLVLSSLGAGLGLLFAQWSSRGLTELLSTSNSKITLDLAPDLRVLLFTTAVGIFTGVLFGVFPAWRSARVSPNAAMKSGGRGLVEGHSRMRIGKVLVVVQVALSMILVAGAGLMLTTFRNLSSLDPGFQAEGLLLVSTDLRPGNLQPDAISNVRAELLRRFRTLPGVKSASLSRLTPVGRGGWNNFIKIDRAPQRPGREALVFFNAVSDNYFATMDTPILEGRDFTERDTASSPLVAIVNESTAKRFFGNASPLGHVLRFEEGPGFSAPYEIVGVVRDAKYRSLRDPAPPTAYLPATQMPGPVGLPTPNYELRVTGSPLRLVSTIKETVASVNPNVSMTFKPMTEQITESLNRERMLATLSGSFGVLALVLAAIGMYGVLSYNVARRRNEIGVRMALGAARERVVQMVLGEAGWLTGIGLGLGIAGTLAATRVLATLLYGLSPDDPPTLGTAAMVLLTAAGISAYLPARRAALVDPMTALRDE